MLTLGLTGGIGTGKTSLARLLERHGAKVLYLDDVARLVLAPGTQATAEVARLWPDVVKDGAIDRKALGQIVFSDERALQRLNAIVHPRTWQAELCQLAAWQSQGVPVALVELALLASSERQWGFHANLVVDAPLPARLDRLERDRAMSSQEASARIASQRPREEVLAIADFVVDNSGSQRELEAAARSAWQEWIAPFAANLTAGRRLHGLDVPPSDDQRHRARQRLEHQGATSGGPRDPAAFARAGFVPGQGEDYVSADPMFRMKV
ncbi:MAG: dephospho-CoA kinase [Actinomycetaceae bacterium]|nr:dephospho-CoA kinase [Actinomycetaceae bacterium]